MSLFYVKGKSSVYELIMTVLVPVLTGALSFVLVKNHTEIYTEFARSAGLPPVAVYPFIWAFALIFMGIASYRMKLAAPASASHTYYAASLILCFLWCVMLLRFELLFAAFFTMIIDIFFLVLTFFDFEKIDVKAGVLMLPALAWSVIAAIINFLLCRGYGGF